ncbi:unnamed protein product [Caenorhabditis angaria]|uniref:Major facilitator superfamily (MFS) profile domain-containing protein n=1 Tax=Caenorhabditis angaria TaxID=860376 RepID=A0A9P1I392_9PELO|nr:unnamed protein product [Caenorhabditis angaria]
MSKSKTPVILPEVTLSSTTTDKSGTVFQKEKSSNTKEKRNDRPIQFCLDSSNSLDTIDKNSKMENGTNNEGSSTRYIILIFTILCLTSIMANIVCFNFTVLCMPASHRINSINSTNKFEPYNHQERTWLFSAVAIGALLAVVPVSHGIARLGCRQVFFLSGILSGLSTVLVPAAASYSLQTFLMMRVLQGISFAACMPTVGSVTSSWASLKQNGFFIAVLTTFGQLSSVFSMPLSGQLCTSSLGWQSVFYFHAAFSFITFIIWYIFFTDSPSSNARVSTRELSVINANKSSASLSADHSSTPYLEIISTPSIWAVWIGALGDLVAVQLIHMFSPLYIRDILGYSVQKTGFAAAVPVLVQFCVKISAGHSSDRIRGVSETTKIRIFNSIALGLSAVFLACCGYVQQGQGLLGLILISLATAMFGFNGGGFNKCATLVSRQYSHFVMANIQFIWCLSMLICPILVSFLLPTSSVSEWRVVFFAHAALLILSNIFFCIFATAKPASWTDRTIRNAARKNRPIFSTNV